MLKSDPGAAQHRGTPGPLGGSPDGTEESLSADRERPPTAASQPASKPKIRVFVVDAHDGSRARARRLIEAARDLSCCGDAGTAPDAIQGICAEMPQVVLLDLHLGATSARDVLNAVYRQQPRPRIVLLSAPDDQRRSTRVVDHRWPGYVAKDASLKEFETAIHRAAGGWRA